MSVEHERRCYHPEEIPNLAGQKAPPAQVRGCQCGQNWCCPVCGFGVWSHPHTCAPERAQADGREGQG